MSGRAATSARERSAARRARRSAPAVAVTAAIGVATSAGAVVGPLVGRAAAVEAVPGSAPVGPAGGDVDLAAPPDEPGARRYVSLRHPVRVYAPPRVAATEALAALAAADRVWDVVTGALSLPAPDGGLDGTWDVYLVDHVAGGGDALVEERDPRARFDRAVTFAVVERSIAPGCGLDLALARALARAVLARFAPATDRGSARAQSEALARLVVPCADPGADTLEFQAHPERAIVDPSSGEFDRGASVFFSWLDARFARQPGSLVAGLWALAPTRTPPDAQRWSATPTGFDVLRESLKGAFGPGPTLDELFAGFSVERTTLEPGPRLAWQVPWPSQARRLASPEPVWPTGASYVVVDHAGAPPGAKLRLEAQWEDYGRMRWAVVKLDAAGRAMAVLTVTSLDRGTRTSMTVESLDDVARVAIVGTNVGSTEHAFDPHQGEWEPHGWLLTIAPE